MNRCAYCQECDEIKEVTGFNRDDPVLECGHIIKPYNMYESINEYMAEVKQKLNAKIAAGKTVSQATAEIREESEEEGERTEMLQEEVEVRNLMRLKGPSL